MKNAGNKGVKAYAFAILFGVSGGLGLWYWGAPNADLAESQRRVSGWATGRGRSADESSRSVQLAGRYVAAVQSGNCDDVVTLTLWMQERLDNAQAEQEMDTLCATLLDRSSEGNRLGPLGIEDRYIFSPQATFEVLETDDGREDLERPVRERTWYKVTYPSKEHAVRDKGGNPISTLVVGVNVSTDGYILKAGVRGNLDIDFDAISYRWPADGE